MLMSESTTYQAIRKEGRIEGMNEGVSQGQRGLILLLGTARFGAPPRRTAAALEKIDDVRQLERLAKRILGATGWKDLLESD